LHAWPDAPLTITEAQVSAPLQLFPSEQLFGLVVQEKVQFVSQPVPGPLLPVPKSQSSFAAASTIPSPQVDGLQAPAAQKPPLQGVPSTAGVPAPHFWPAFPPTLTLPHFSVPLHVF
jgi:hypothetical protein